MTCFSASGGAAGPSCAGAAASAPPPSSRAGPSGADAAGGEGGGGAGEGLADGACSVPGAGLGAGAGPGDGAGSAGGRAWAAGDAAARASSREQAGVMARDQRSTRSPTRSIGSRREEPSADDLDRLPERQPLLIDEDLDLPVSGELAENEVLRQHILYVLLDGTTERARAVGTVAAGAVDQPTVSLIGDSEPDP